MQNIKNNNIIFKNKIFSYIYNIIYIYTIYYISNIYIYNFKYIYIYHLNI